MAAGAPGKTYHGREIIVHQGETGDHICVIQDRRVGVSGEEDNKEVPHAVPGTEDMLGEVALAEKDMRSAAVRAMRNVRVLTVDRRTFFYRIQGDPSLALRILRKMSHRIRELDSAFTRQKSP